MGANRSRSVASGRHCRADARPARSPNQPLLSHASLTQFFRDMCNCRTRRPRICHPQFAIPIILCRCILPQIIGSWKITQMSCCYPVIDAKAPTDLCQKKCSPTSATLLDKTASPESASLLFKLTSMTSLFIICKKVPPFRWIAHAFKRANTIINFKPVTMFSSILLK